MTSPVGSCHVMFSVPLPTAVQENVVELPLPTTESDGASDIIGGSPEITKVSLINVHHAMILI